VLIRFLYFLVAVLLDLNKKAEHQKGRRRKEEEGEEKS